MSNNTKIVKGNTEADNKKNIEDVSTALCHGLVETQGALLCQIILRLSRVTLKQIIRKIVETSSMVLYHGHDITRLIC